MEQQAYYNKATTSDLERDNLLASELLSTLVMLLETGCNAQELLEFCFTEKIPNNVESVMHQTILEFMQKIRLQSNIEGNAMNKTEIEHIKKELNKLNFKEYGIE